MTKFNITMSEYINDIKENELNTLIENTHFNIIPDTKEVNSDKSKGDISRSRGLSNYKEILCNIKDEQDTERTSRA